jgi:hypothetical protein
VAVTGLACAAVGWDVLTRKRAIGETLGYFWSLQGARFDTKGGTEKPLDLADLGAFT